MKKLLGIVCVLLSLTSLGVPGPCFAADPEDPKETARLTAFFNKLDLDGDGKVPHDEFKEFWGRLFDSVDKNDDGVHDQTEILSGRHFEVFDLNKDGVISFGEELSVRNRHWKHFDVRGRGWISLNDFLARGRGKVDPDAYDYETTFTKMDADRDGLLTEEEYLAFWSDYFDSRDADDDEALNAAEHGHAESFGAFDADSDGKIERKEDALVRAEDFKQLDADGNGSLTQSEFVR